MLPINHKSLASPQEPVLRHAQLAAFATSDGKVQASSLEPQQIPQAPPFAALQISSHPSAPHDSTAAASGIVSLTSSTVRKCSAD